MKVSVSRKEHFNAAHRLAKAEWSAEKNFEVFGKCSLPNYHGHNYEVIVTVTGTPHPDTGYVIDMKWLSDLVKANISSRFDHKNLNLDVPEFKNLNPTAENIVIVIWNILRPKIDPALHLKIKLYETERNFVEYPSE
jgi:6-pyruvoyltetrahydropterin/6-carboxytetrahydropterin synthase